MLLRILQGMFLVILISAGVPRFTQAADCEGLAKTAGACKIIADVQADDILPLNARSVVDGFTAAYFDTNELSDRTVANALIKFLPADVQKACTEAMQRARSLSVNDPQIFCFRPTCIAKNSERARSCPSITTLSPSNLTLLRSYFAGASCASKADCVSVSPEALELITAADVLWSFLAANLSPSSNSPCQNLDRDKCANRLWEMMNVASRAYQEGSKLHYLAQWLQSKPGTAPEASLAAFRKFEIVWNGVQTAAKEAQRKGGIDLFLLKPGVLEALAATDRDASEARIQLDSWINDERIDVARKILAQGKVLFEQTGAEDFLAKFKADWAAKGFNDPNVELTPDRARELIRGFRTQIDDGLWLARDTKAAVATTAPVPCGSDARAGLDLRRGLFDICYSKVDAATPVNRIVGLRLTFVPCASEASASNCRILGSLFLLINGAPSATRPINVLALGLGATNFAAKFDEDNFLRIRGVAPATNYHQSSQDLQALVDLLLPPPFKGLVREIDLSDGPTLAFKLDVSTIPSGKLLDLSVIISRNGVSINNSSPIQDLAVAIAEKSLVKLKGGTATFAGMKFSIDEATINTSGDGCLKRDTPEIRLTVRARANIVDANVLGHLLSCGDSFKYSINADQTAIADALAKKFGALRDDVKVYILDGTLRASLWTEIEGCKHEVDIDILKADAASVSNTLKKAVTDQLACRYPTILNDLEAGLEALGFHKTAQAGTYCTANLGVVGSICIVGSTDGNNQPTFQVIEDPNLYNRLSAQLQTVFGPKSRVKAVSVSKTNIAMTSDIDVPMIGVVDNVSVGLKPESGALTVNFDVYQALREAIKARVDLSKVAASFSGVEVGNIGLVEDNPETLTLKGTISYGGIPGDVIVQVLPTFKISPQAPQLSTDLLRKFFGPISALDGVNFYVGKDGIPAVTANVKVSLPIDAFPLEAGATLSARAGKPIRFDGPVSFVTSMWLKAGYVDIGRIRASVDMNKPLEKVTVGASLAFPEGSATYDLAALDTELTISQTEISLIGSLKLLSSPLGSATGVWKFKEGMLDIDVSAGEASEIIPLPTGHLTVDGPACAVVGTSSAKLFGASLVNVSAGLFLGQSICNVGPAKSSLVVSMIEACGERGQAGQVCLRGNANFGEILNAQGMLSARLDKIIPNITGKIDLARLATFDVAVDSARAAFETRVLGFRVNLILPSVDGLDEDFLRKLIENLLKPSIDLSAVLKGDITIAPASKSGSGGGTAGNSTNSGGASGNDGNQVSPQGAGTAEIEVNPPSSGGNYLWEPGNSSIKLLEVNGTGLWRVMTTFGNQSYSKYPYLFRKADAEDLASGRKGLPYDIPAVIANGKVFKVACDSWPCSLDKVSIVRAFDYGDKAEETPAQEINISELEKPLRGSSAPIVAALKRGYFNLPGVVAFLVERHVKGDTSAVNISCVRSNAACRLALIASGDRYQLDDGGWGVLTELPAGSVARAVYVNACASSPCKTSPLLDNFDKLVGEYQLLARGTAIPGALPTAMILAQEKDGSVTIVNVNQDLAITATAPIDLNPRPYDSFFRPPTTELALTSLVDAASSDIAPGSDFTARTALPIYASLLDRGSRSIWSILKRADGVCIRKTSEADLTKTLREWRTNDFVDAVYADKLLANAGLENLLGDIVNPIRSESKFHITPMLLQGDPTKDCAK